ncbi:hypothetical protein EYF80_030689 [Liparis tanakae]|uniref:Uncharacterized protein n=1 Tax=Liparis tanakae TaxID=230148 RepID=A0A4Z2H137_9TELE|nr:hypothetical protein EYF80_030689 [Liparis tanakae]
MSVQRGEGPLLTFQRDPVVFPLAPRCRFHLLVLLVNQEVLDSQSSGLPDDALSAANQRVRWIRAAEGAAAPLVAHGGAGLLLMSLTGEEREMSFNNNKHGFSYTPPRPASPARPSPPPALLLPLSLPLNRLLSVAEYTEKEADMALQRRDTSSPSTSAVTPSMPLSPYSLPSPRTPEMS